VEKAKNAIAKQIKDMKKFNVFKGNLKAVTPGPDFSSVKSEWEVDGTRASLGGMTFRQPSEH
jgi:hypothetical protein